ncbi:hypothetical protein CEXT_7211 [Caerostris extrusa]|uniref:Uncharacterized protein n=1 Tax=Caerostris extrusa TaxID=172846 RepID=A0AAV4MW24_CAEEX|nr:hypothetical protein CEXT_7211 [Caerostris extrusa]
MKSTSRPFIKQPNTKRIIHGVSSKIEHTGNIFIQIKEKKKKKGIILFREVIMKSPRYVIREKLARIQSSCGLRSVGVLREKSKWLSNCGSIDILYRKKKSL